MNYIYHTSQVMQEKIEASLQLIYKKAGPLEVNEYPNATIVPFGEVREGNKIFYPRFGGVLDEKSEIIENSQLVWCDNKGAETVSIGAVPQKMPPPVFVDEDVIYLGHVDEHFGHFLVDSMQRLYLAYGATGKKRRYAYISDGQDKFLDFLYLAGIERSELLHVAQPTRFRRVVVCEPSIRYIEYYHNQFKRVCSKISSSVQSSGHKKVYLSRTKAIDLPGRVYGEEPFEKIFAANGYHIAYPERLSIYNQIALMKDCESLAGVTGSALHLMMFAPDNIDVTYLYRSDHVIHMQMVFDHMVHARGTHVGASSSPLPVESFCSPFLVGLTEHVADWLTDSGLTIPANVFADEEHAVKGFISHWKSLKGEIFN